MSLHVSCTLLTCQEDPHRHRDLRNGSEHAGQECNLHGVGRSSKRWTTVLKASIVVVVGAVNRSSGSCGVVVAAVAVWQ